MQTVDVGRLSFLRTSSAFSQVFFMICKFRSKYSKISKSLRPAQNKGGITKNHFFMREITNYLGHLIYLPIRWSVINSMSLLSYRLWVNLLKRVVFPLALPPLFLIWLYITTPVKFFLKRPLVTSMLVNIVEMILVLTKEFFISSNTFVKLSPLGLSHTVV